MTPVAVHVLTWTQALPIMGACILYVLAASLREHRRRTHSDRGES